MPNPSSSSILPVPECWHEAFELYHRMWGRQAAGLSYNKRLWTGLQQFLLDKAARDGYVPGRQPSNQR